MIIVCCIVLCVCLVVYVCILHITHRQHIVRSFKYVNYTNISVSQHPIDAVITWVDTKDEKWRKMKSDIMGTEDNNPSRWADNMSKPDVELEYCISSILKHMPYIRRIHVVTMRPQIPQCLDSNPSLHKQYISGRINIVHHDTIFENPWKNKTTFNSFGIESFLHNIPTLAEQFVYFNDDMYVIRDIPSNTLFYNGKAIQRGRLHYTTYLDAQECKDTDKQWCATKKTYNLILDTFGVLFIPNHQFKCLTRRMAIEATKHFNLHIHTTRNNAIRSKNDVVVDNLFINYGLHSEMAVIGNNDDVKDMFIEAGDYPSLIIPTDIKTICINNCNSSECERMLKKTFGTLIQ